MVVKCTTIIASSKNKVFDKNDLMHRLSMLKVIHNGNTVYACHCQINNS